ncbi:PRC-barrel domain-containing protein [Antarctobacter sp.]|uniref:PRC-barrel domain-containing protein n=1 Tax=Antarctobacter sp. TaxID=1872577 RepID=UPI003A91294D
MLHDLSELSDTPLETLSGPAALREVFFDRATGRIRLVAIEMTQAAPRTEALIDAARLSTPVHEAGGWTLAVGDDEIAEALSWPEVLDSDAQDLTIWPMVVAGPLGTSFAPLLALSALRANMPESDDTSPDTQTANELVAPLEQASDWIGAAVFGQDGELGRLTALLFEPATRTIRGLRLTDTPDGGPCDLPFASLRHRAEAGGHLVVDAHRADLKTVAETEL